VQNVAQTSKKAQQLTTGLLMENFIAYSVENQSIASFSLLQLMKKLTRVLEITSPVKQKILKFSDRDAWLFYAIHSF